MHLSITALYNIVCENVHCVIRSQGSPLDRFYMPKSLSPFDMSTNLSVFGWSTLLFEVLQHDWYSALSFGPDRLSRSCSTERLLPAKPLCVYGTFLLTWLLPVALTKQFRTASAIMFFVWVRASLGSCMLSTIPATAHIGRTTSLSLKLVYKLNY